MKFIYKATFLNSTELMGRWSGITVGIGSYVTYNIIKENRQIIHTLFVRKLDDHELKESKIFEDFSVKVNSNIKNIQDKTNPEGCIFNEL